MTRQDCLYPSATIWLLSFWFTRLAMATSFVQNYIYIGRQTDGHIWQAISVHWG